MSFVLVSLTLYISQVMLITIIMIIITIIAIMIWGSGNNLCTIPVHRTICFGEVVQPVNPLLDVD